VKNANKKLKNKMKNKKIVVFSSILILISFSGFYINGALSEQSIAIKLVHRGVLNSPKDQIKNGDLIFQTSVSKQSKAIQLATKSKYSHCGIIYQNGKDFYVLEAIQPVQLTLLRNWINRGKDGKYVIKRLKNSDKVLTSIVISKMKNIGEKFKGKNYDFTFDWSDDKIYCSELIWKIYKEATGLEIGKLQKLKGFDLTNPVVRTKMRERYGNNIPLNEPVISPGAIFNSDLLITVKSN
jgi:predicted DNA-binding WGR domain protein